MNFKRNVGMHTDESESIKNILVFMASRGLNNPNKTIIKSAMGCVAYPNYSFRSPQGAAFSVAKVARKMEQDKLIDYTFDDVTRGYYLTLKGLEMAESLKGDQS